MKRLINLQPSRASSLGLGLSPLVLLVLAYWLASDARLAENPNDKLMPAFGSFVDAIERLAFEPNKRSGEYLFWNDTAASLKRIGLGVGLSALIGLTFGILCGLLPLVRAGLSPLVTIISLIPPMAILRQEHFDRDVSAFLARIGVAPEQIALVETFAAQRLGKRHVQRHVDQAHAARPRLFDGDTQGHAFIGLQTNEQHILVLARIIAKDQMAWLLWCRDLK